MARSWCPPLFWCCCAAVLCKGRDPRPPKLLTAPQLSLVVVGDEEQQLRDAGCSTAAKHGDDSVDLVDRPASVAKLLAAPQLSLSSIAAAASQSVNDDDRRGHEPVEEDPPSLLYSRDKPAGEGGGDGGGKKQIEKGPNN